jgi:hypothetical protein
MLVRPVTLLLDATSSKASERLMNPEEARE